MNETIVYEQKEVFVIDEAANAQNDDPSDIETCKVVGRLQLVRNRFSTFIRFLPNGCEASIHDEWDLLLDNPVFSYSKDSENDSVSMEHRNAKNMFKLQFDLNDLSSVRRVYQGYGFSHVVFMLKDGRTWPSLHFMKGGTKELLKLINNILGLKKEDHDATLWYVPAQNSVQFQQSMYELNLFSDQREDAVKKFLNQPIQSTLLSFSKVTSIFKDALKPSDSNSMTFSLSSLNDAHSTPAKSSANRHHHHHSHVSPNFNIPMNHASTEEEMSNGLMDSLTSENIHSTLNDGYEMVTKVDLGPMPVVERGTAVRQIKYDPDGRVLNVDELKKSIFRGGVEPELRSTLWKFLLEYYDWNSTIKSRAEKRKLRENDYFRIKLQWESMNDEQKQRFSLMKERESLIEKDVARTDRQHVYFEGDENKNLVVMHDILMTYNMYNFDLGYVQGMSDLLAPIMVLMNDEVDSFWCFVGFMNKIESNFLMDQLNIKLQLSNLKSLLEFVDSKFFDYLDRNDSANMYFCFRWILILFKREFSFPDCMKLWEILWTDLPCKNFHLLICVAILLTKKDDIIANNYGFNEILKFINDLSLRIDLDKTLQYAEGLFLQIRNFKNLPANICQILDLPVSNEAIGEPEQDTASDRKKEMSSSRPPAKSPAAANDTIDVDKIESLN